MFLFGFGKKRRRSTKSKKGGKKARKPAAKLLRLCKKLKVKTTVKRGSKRVYKSTRILKKLCSKKMRMNKKKKMSFGRRKSRKVRSSKRSKRSTMEELDDMEFGRRSRFGSSCGGSASMMNTDPKVMNFGKKRKGTRKISKPAAMRAFKQFYRRHCRSSAMGRRFRFGSGGNPMLSQSMGYEFCPSGMGGVLATTGLFPSPCTPFNQAQATAEANATLPEYTTTPAGAFGRRYRRKCYGKGKSRYCLRMKPKRKDLYYLSSRGRV